MTAGMSSSRMRRVKPKVFARDGWRCVECGGKQDLTLDHVIPRALGGSNRQENLQTMCRLCNERKGSEWTVKEGQHVAGHTYYVERNA